MQALSILSLWVAGALGILAALGRIHYPLHWGTTTFDGVVALVAAICLAHAIARTRRRSAMGAIRFGSSH